MMTRTLFLVASAALLSACVSQPKPLQGTFTETTPSAAMQGESIGAAVRWGGRIVAVEPRADSTCFEMISSNLDSGARPTRDIDASSGRFIACRAGFYDPAVFEANREVTFTGRIDGYETRRIGEYDYRLPRVAADVVYLWPLRTATSAYPPPFYRPYYSPFYSPFYSGWYPGWGWPWGWW